MPARLFLCRKTFTLSSTDIFFRSHVRVGEGLVELFATTTRLMHRLLDHVVVTMSGNIKIPPTHAEVLSVGVSHCLSRAA